MEAIMLPHPAKVTPEGNNRYAVTLEPLHPGYGVTIGNAMRRVLLSSMPGAAVTAVKIKFVDHEFSTIPHVREDVIQIILNLKNMRVHSTSMEPVRVRLHAKGEKTVTAADLIETDQVTVANKDQYIATLDSKNAELDMELIIEQGRGYVPVEARENEHLEVGMLAVDAIYSPVRSVYFDITNVRVGQITNYDKLLLSIETDGTIDGRSAVEIAANILVDHFKMMLTGEIEMQDNFTTISPFEQAQLNAAEVSPEQEVVEDQDLSVLNLSNRAKNALAKEGITSVKQLEALSTEAIENISGLGKKTITEILTALER